MMDKELHTNIGKYCRTEPLLCGSRYTCQPPPEDTDEDWLVLLNDDDNDVSEFVSTMNKMEFLWEGSEHYQSAMADFMSFRRGEVNLIVTRKVDFWRRHTQATSVCRQLNIMSKNYRIKIFQAILYGDRE